MNNTLTKQAKVSLEEAGFQFVRREDDGWWLFMCDGKQIGQSRSQGDLIRKFATELGAW